MEFKKLLLNYLLYQKFNIKSKAISLSFPENNQSLKKLHNLKIKIWFLVKISLNFMTDIIKNKQITHT